MFTTLPFALAGAGDSTGIGRNRIPSIWIPATIGVGLALAAVYLGSRILAGHAHAKPAPQVAAPRLRVKRAEAIPTPPSPIEPAKETIVARRVGVAGGETIAPEPGKLYIQLGALGTEAASHLLKLMRDRDLEPHIAPGPDPQTRRVLLGPFDTSDALGAAKAQLEEKGIQYFVRRY